MSKNKNKVLFDLKEFPYIFDILCENSIIKEYVDVECRESKKNVKDFR
jgi:hypothetical protein